MNKYKTDVLSELINNERHQIKEQFELEKENIRNNLLKEKDKEIERLNNIINEIEEYILNHYIVGHTIQNASLDDILNKLKELKEKSD